jgi:hypothetical protein
LLHIDCQLAERVRNERYSKKFGDKDSSENGAGTAAKIIRPLDTLDMDLECNLNQFLKEILNLKNCINYL